MVPYLPRAEAVAAVAVAQRLRLGRAEETRCAGHPGMDHGAEPVLVRPDLHIAWRDAALPEQLGELVDVVTGHGRAGR
ncbi:hypothetical protein AB3X52_15265 [Nocardioides sp. DS6]|uniref:Uncharacterized protein n=1 Tax=Nocardioides eburneus TaxID=3231482 RepID=A0ABV3T1A9_9ACTN